MKRISILCVFTCLILFISCRKESDTTVFEESSSSSLTGFIVDNDKPVKDASIVVNGVTTTTDEYGFFKIDKIDHIGKIVVKANKAGYFPGSRTLFVKDTNIKNVKIDLIPKDQRNTFDAVSGGIINADKGLILNFPADGIVDKSGQSYTGKVTVYTKYLNTDEAMAYDEMPGTLIGVNATGENNYLQSYGMAGVLLEDQSGNALQIKSGKSVELQVKIPSSLKSTAPATIPLWYYDETSGLWKEEGSAVKDGDFYKGTVGHFSFWNCDYPYGLAKITGTVTINGSPINAKIAIKVNNLNQQRIGYTDDKGNLYALVPANETLTLQLLSQCDDVLFSETIPPIALNETYDLGSLLGNNPHIVKYIKYQGSVTDCQGLPLTDGIVQIKTKSETNTVSIDGNGKFSYEGFACNDNYLTMTAISTMNGQASKTIYLTPQTLLLNINLQACGNTPDEYIKLNFSNGDKKILFGSFYKGIKPGLFSENERAILEILSTISIESDFEKGIKNWMVKSFFLKSGSERYTNEKSTDRSQDIVTFTTPYKATNEYLEGSITVKNITKNINNLPVVDKLTVTGEYRIKNK